MPETDKQLVWSFSIYGFFAAVFFSYRFITQTMYCAAIGADDLSIARYDCGEADLIIRSVVAGLGWPAFVVFDAMEALFGGQTRMYSTAVKYQVPNLYTDHGLYLLAIGMISLTVYYYRSAIVANCHSLYGVLTSGKVARASSTIFRSVWLVALGLVLGKIIRG